MSCIGCALCIDACDAVMDRYGLPKGLISYDSDANLRARRAGAASRFHLLRPRTVLYLCLLAVVGGGMLASLLLRSSTGVNILHERTPLFVSLSDGSVRNGYTYKILNMVREGRSYRLQVEGIAGARMDIVGGDSGVTATTLAAAPDSVATYRIYVDAPRDSIHGVRTPLELVLTAPDGRTVRSETLFAGPE